MTVKHKAKVASFADKLRAAKPKGKGCFADALTAENRKKLELAAEMLKSGEYRGSIRELAELLREEFGLESLSREALRSWLDARSRGAVK